MHKQAFRETNHHRIPTWGWRASHKNGSAINFSMGMHPLLSTCNLQTPISTVTLGECKRADPRCFLPSSLITGTSLVYTPSWSLSSSASVFKFRCRFCSDSHEGADISLIFLVITFVARGSLLFWSIGLGENLHCTSAVLTFLLHFVQMDLCIFCKNTYINHRGTHTNSLRARWRKSFWI